MLNVFYVMIALFSLVRLTYAQRVEDPPREPLPDNRALVAAVEKYVAERAAGDEFSGVVLVAHQGKALSNKAYGFADREKRIPNSVDTRFNVGSISKSFTALAIHQLIDQGKLTLNDTLIKLLPDYPNKDAARKITVQHLLDMTSGVGDIFGERFMSTPKSKLRTIKDYLPLFADKPLQFEPGTSRRYSNGGYIVLGAIIEKVTGSDYYSYVQQNIFTPAGMTSSGWFALGDGVSQKAVGYTRPPGSDGERKPNTEMMPARGSSAGGGYSACADLLKYTIALQKGTICPPQYHGRNGLGIAGGAPGVNAMLEWMPETGYAVIVLSNFDPPSAEDIAMKIVSWLPE